MYLKNNSFLKKLFLIIVFKKLMRFVSFKFILFEIAKLYKLYIFPGEK